MRRGVGLDRGDGVCGIRRLAEVAHEQLDACAHRVDVRVLEAGTEQSAVELHDARPCVDESVDLRLGHHRRDAAVGHGDRLTMDRISGAREDGTADEEHVSSGQRRTSLPR
ncbi:MAG: hypothetical protein K0S05_1973 [Agromyces sp.]|nr:hypothetical protein [Agromyces sp.]